MLDKYGKRQLENLARAGGRKGTFKVDGPAVLHQVLHHLGRNRKRKAPPGEKMMKAQLLHGESCWGNWMSILYPVVI
jgi:hypothetical protein